MSAREIREVLDSWKEISAYLGRDVRTCRRWEAHLGLPVHRLNGSSRARVRAYKDEIDRWLEMKLHEREILPGTAVPAPAFLRHWPVVAAFVAVLAIGVLGWRTINNGRPHFVPGETRAALAVLPFVNGTGEDGLDYLRESLPHHLIRDLQRSADHMRVFSFDVVVDALRKLKLEPGAAFAPGDLAAFASRTGAEWLLVSSVAKSGSKLRVDYELRDPASLGSGAASSPSAALKTDRVPGTEAEAQVIVGRVADGIRRAFGVPVLAGTEALIECSVQATRYYETARAIERKYVLSLDPADLEKIIGLFNQAREADPGCAMAYLGLGDAYQHKFVYEDRDPEALRLLKENYRRAYEMAPERAETNVGVSWIHFIEGDNDQAYACLKKAMGLDRASL
jgi:TolB-like protein